ncbi:MAG: hypothetical protein P4L33_19660 [Capsulimonadaceae bacterium]|nr:hypothetical protein [Capsulimonadaceae bacterium]
MGLDKGDEKAENALLGFADSATFGLSGIASHALYRAMYHEDFETDTSSREYMIGEAVEGAGEVVFGGPTSLLKYAARKVAFKEGKRLATESAARELSEATIARRKSIAEGLKSADKAKRAIARKAAEVYGNKVLGDRARDYARRQARPVAQLVKGLQEEIAKNATKSGIAAAARHAVATRSLRAISGFQERLEKRELKAVTKFIMERARRKGKELSKEEAEKLAEVIDPQLHHSAVLVGHHGIAGHFGPVSALVPSLALPKEINGLAMFTRVARNRAVHDMYQTRDSAFERLVRPSFLLAPARITRDVYNLVAPSLRHALSAAHANIRPSHSPSSPKRPVAHASGEPEGIERDAQAVLRWHRAYESGVDYRTGQPFASPKAKAEAARHIAAARTDLDRRQWAHSLPRGKNPLKQPVSASLEEVFKQTKVPSQMRRKWSLAETGSAGAISSASRAAHARNLISGARLAAANRQRSAPPAAGVATSGHARRIARNASRGPVKAKPGGERAVGTKAGSVTSVAAQAERRRLERLDAIAKRPLVVNVSLDRKIVQTVKTEMIDDVLKVFAEEVYASRR